MRRPSDQLWGGASSAVELRTTEPSEPDLRLWRAHRPRPIAPRHPRPRQEFLRFLAETRSAGCRLIALDRRRPLGTGSHLFEFNLTCQQADEDQPLTVHLGDDVVVRRQNELPAKLFL